jgi:hypothetical protein
MEPYLKKDQNFENWLKFQLEFVFNTNIKNLNDLKITNSLSFDLDLNFKQQILYNNNNRSNKDSIDYLINKSILESIMMTKPSYLINIDFLKLLKERTYHSYVKNIQFSSILTFSTNCLMNNDFINENEPNISKELIWQGKGVTWGQFSQWLTKYAKELDGFNKLNADDLLTVISTACICLYACHTSCFFDVNNECRMIISNKIQTTKKRLTQIFDSNIVDEMFKFIYLFKHLNLNNEEMSLLYPFILSNCDTTKIGDKESLFKIKSNYTKCLLFHFDLNGHDSEFYKTLNDCFKISTGLEMNKENLFKF